MLEKSIISSENPTIIFENSHLAAINKPAGLVVHSDGKTDEKTLCDWILSKWPKVKGVGEPLIINKGTPKEQVIDRPGIVHRLDRETSGVIVIAKTQESFENLKLQFQEREIEKVYHCFVWGIVKDDKGTIDRPIGRSKSDFRKWSAERFARGELRPSVTNYKVLARHIGASGSLMTKEELDAETPTQRKIPHDFTYLEVMPLTGRTHQIRVHFKAINHPVVCDGLYAPNHPDALGFKRTALHAYKIRVGDLDGVEHEFEAPLPEDFAAASLLIK